MGLTVLASQLISAVVLLISTFAIGTLPSIVGSRSRKKVIAQADHLRRTSGHDGISRASSGGGSSGDGYNQQLGVAHVASQATTFVKVLSFLMNFGGGVLLATCLVHMLPEVRESFEESHRADSVEQADDPSSPTTTAPQKLGDNFPLTEVLVCAGFFMIYFAEEVVHACIAHSHHHAEAKSGSTKKGHKANHEHSKKRKNLLSSANVCEREQLEVAIICQTGANYGAITCQSNDLADDSDRVLILPSASSQLPPSCALKNQCPDQAGPSAEANESQTIFRCLLIVFALSFHSLFDGLAIGLQETVAHVWQLLLAISLHKFLIAFVIGLDVYAETLSLKRVMIYMLPFSIMSPIGIVVACFTKVNVSDYTNGVLSAISAGSLLYITFFEILLRERSSSKIPGLLQFAAVLMGFGLMTVLHTLTEHDH